jgi:hypothetical protein
MCNNYNGITVKNSVNGFNADTVTRLLKYYQQNLTIRTWLSEGLLIQCLCL